MDIAYPKKFCTRCKSIQEFSFNKRRSDGLQFWCKECTKKYSNEYRIARNKRAKERRLLPEWNVQVTKRRERRIENAQEINERNRRRYAEDPKFVERLKKNTRIWHEKNPHAYASRAMRRLVRKRGVTVDRVNYDKILNRDMFWCYICEQNITDVQRLQFDHVIPISRGGLHVEENIKVAHAVCNNRKHNKLVSELAPFDRRGP